MKEPAIEGLRIVVTFLPQAVNAFERVCTFYNMPCEMSSNPLKQMSIFARTLSQEDFKANRNIFLKDGRGRGTSALREIDSETRAPIVLAGLTFTPDLFACGVDPVGVANLITWKDAR